MAAETMGINIEIKAKAHEPDRLRQVLANLGQSTCEVIFQDLLSTTLGVRGVVKKQRLLYRIGNSRVHLDDVDRLGFFVELEVVLNERQASEDGKFVAEEIMKQLGICETDWVACAYIDLLERRTK